jgi:ribosomal protein S18 acetylase RimI-like enzyme
VEREGQIIACAALFPFFEEKCGEVAALAVSPDCRGQGQGDKLLGMILNFPVSQCFYNSEICIHRVGHISGLVHYIRWSLVYFDRN